MIVRKAVLGVVLAIAALGALAAQAAAVTPEGDPAGGKFPVAGTGTSGTTTLTTTNRSVSCTSGTGSGQATSSTTGEGSAVLHGCTSSGTSCTTAGQASGTIVIPTLVSHLVYLDENHTVPGALATPPASGVFAKFACGFGLVQVEIKGNGILGQITAPLCGQTSSTGTVVSASSSPGVQKYQQIEETGTKYDLTATINGTTETASVDGTVNGTSAEKGTFTCPEQK